MQKLLLFDIDGTLLWGGGAAKRAFHGALLTVFEVTGPIEDHDFGGKTDPQIARELLRLAGLDDEAIDAGLPALWSDYLVGLEEGLVDHPPTVLPGVWDLLDRLAALEDVALGLVTGNISGGAALKLESVGMGDRFAVGAYGSDHELRNHLPGVAIRRARDEWEVDFDERDVWIIGDTPRDVECGKHHGVMTLAVATGRFAQAQLVQANPDVVVDDLSDTERVVEIILG